jgi:hypothetical protein
MKISFFFLAHTDLAHTDFCSAEVAAAAATTGPEANKLETDFLVDGPRAEAPSKLAPASSTTPETRSERGSHRARKAPDHFDPGLVVI